MLEQSLDWRITLGSALMARLDSGERLSAVLPAVKNLAQLIDDKEIAAFLSMVIYALTMIPDQPSPFTNPVYREAGEVWLKLAMVRDSDRLTTDEILHRGVFVERNKVVTASIFELEGHEPPPPLQLGTSPQLADLTVQQAHMYRDTLDVINRVQSYVYDYVSENWRTDLRERDHIQLLGQDYHIVLNALGVLDTEVGDELVAALDQLRSENAAS
jgi:hypothetical protein